MDSAHSKKNHVLVTDTSSFLGEQIAASLLSQNYSVFGMQPGHLKTEILTNPDFTLLELDLSQPLPTYLPEFDIIYDLSPYEKTHSNGPNSFFHLTPQTKNLIYLAQTTKAQIAFIAKIGTPTDFYDLLTKGDSELKSKIKLFLVGDLYGPHMHLKEDGLLSDLIIQAVKTDKVILENEGLASIYPAYITDVLFAINKFSFSKSNENIHTLISQPPKTALNVAYEIQHILQSSTGKDVELFFKEQSQTAHINDQIEIHQLGFVPQVHLQQGLRETFKFFKSQDEIKLSTAVFPNLNQQSQSHHLTQHEKLPKQNHLVQRIPTNLPAFRFKLILKVFILLLLLTLTKTAIDVYLGINSLKKTQQSLIAADFKSAHQEAESAQKSIIAAKNKIDILLFLPGLIAKNQKQGLNLAISSAVNTANASSHLAAGLEVLRENVATLTNPDIKNSTLDFETPSADFKKASLSSAQALSQLQQAQDLLPNKIADEKVNQVSLLNLLSQKAYELTNLIPQIAPGDTPKTYLVLLQNNTELRPGGGFIGNVAKVEFDSGKLKAITVEDIYVLDGQLEENIQPPAPLAEKLGVQRLYLRDSNWSPDFAQNAQTARDLYNKETGTNVDGVIAVDLTFIQEVLKSMGPLQLTDYNEQINAENLFERGEYYSEIGFFPGSTQKRDFFGALTRTMIAKIITDLHTPTTNSSSWLALIQTSTKALNQKHMMLSFEDPVLESYVQTHGTTNKVPPTAYDPTDDSQNTRDFLSIVEANVGANKVNRSLDRKIEYEMTIGRDANLVGKLTITYKNNSLAETWPGGKYTNYLRVYVPHAAGLEDFKLSIPQEQPKQTPKRTTAKLTPQEDGVVDVNDVEVINQGDLTIFATYVEVPIKSTQVVTFTYRIPKNIDLEQVPIYSLYVQKQPGTEKDPFIFRFNLPAYIRVNAVNDDGQFKDQQNISIDTNLETDKQFTVDLVKN